MSFLNTQIGLSYFVSDSRKIESISVDVIMSESSNDSLEITKHPVQMGAMISDHAYKNPTTLSMTILQNATLPSGLQDIYDKFLKLQEKVVPFVVSTPKRIYRDMLIQTLAVTTDKNTENCLSINISFQQVIIVKTSTVLVPVEDQKSPAKTAKTEKTGQRSAFRTAGDGINAALGVKP